MSVNLGLFDAQDGWVVAQAPTLNAITAYDQRHFYTYASLLSAERDGLDWCSVAQTVLDLDIDADPDAAHLCWQSHLARAHWLVGEGLMHLGLEDDHAD